MYKRYIVFLISFALTGTVALAQLSQADKLFKSYSYSLAIPQYLKIAQKSSGPDRDHAIVRLADCYRLVNDQLNAKAWYARAVAIPNTEPINWFYYGEALRCAQEYDLAKEAYLKYSSLDPDNIKGKEYAAFCTEISRLNDIPAGFEIKNVASINSDKSDFGPAFYSDGIIFVSDRRQNFMDNKKYEWTDNNYLDLFFATPKYLDEFYQEMNEPKSFSEKFNQTYHDGPAAFARHDSLIYFTRTDKGKEKKDADNYRTDRLKIFWAKYDGSWSKTKEFPLNSNNFSVGHPFLTPDGNTIYFVSDMPESLGGTDIFICHWVNGKWSDPENPGPSVNSFGDEMFPSINGNQLYFSSNGFAGFGGLDLFKSTFKDGKWSKAENLGAPVNSSFDDFSLVLDARGKKGFFSSNRPGGMGSDDIYACKVIESKPKKPELAVQQLQDSLTMEISGFVKDKQTLLPMAFSTVFLLNSNTDKVDVIKTDANGRFKARIDKGVFYVAKAMENNYISDCINFKFETADTSHAGLTPRDLLLDHLELNKVFTVKNMDYAIETIYYDFDKWFIRADAETELDKLVQLMRENPVSVELGSHTDSRGTKEYNIELSQKRADAAVRYIVQHGINASRITAQGYGESQIINQCTDGVPCSEAEHQANRRTEFKVTGFLKQDANSDYDMQKFKGDEQIPVYMFDRDFFINCLQEKKMDKYKADPSSENIPTDTKTQPDYTTASPEKTTTSYEQAAVPVAKPVSRKNEVTEKPVVKEKPVTQIKTMDPATQVKETPKAVNTPETSNGAVTYRVQLLALANEKSLLDPEFELLEDVQMYIEGGLYKYTSGVFNTHEEGLAYRAKMVQMGYTDAFVVTFSNGKRIYIGPAN